MSSLLDMSIAIYIFWSI